MRLLIITQKVNKNDSVLGFFHEWIAEFSKHVEKITVICLEAGEYNLPKNVEVHSLGKEKKRSRIQYLIRFFRHIIWEQKDNYDVVLVHMNPIYIVLAGWYWRITKKKIVLWYTHKSVDWKLRIAEKFSHIIFSASKESFRLSSNKLFVTGHGIDTEKFSPVYTDAQDSSHIILTVGRISPTKGHHVVVDAVRRLRESGIHVRLVVIGAPVTKEEFVYEKLLKEKSRDFAEFVGPIAHADIVPYFQRADVFVNASQTESLDKTILEAMSCGTPVVSSNDSAIGILKKFNENFVFEKEDSVGLAQSLEYFFRMKGGLHYLQEEIHREVVEKHNLGNLIKNLVKIMNTK